MDGGFRDGERVVKREFYLLAARFDLASVTSFRSILGSFLVITNWYGFLVVLHGYAR